MAGMGPPPKPDNMRRRRNATPGTTRLPAEGRTGPAPRWPIGPDIETAASLAVAREKVAEFLELQEAGKPVSEARLDLARQRVKVLEHVVAIQAKAERALWRDLWKRPQAVAWEHDGYIREVALYVRLTILGENGNLNATKEARQHADRFGLNPQAMLRLRWSVADDEVAAARADRTADLPARRRLQVVDTPAAM